MARQVFDARMLAHIWANGSQDSARTSSGNLFFSGPTLNSYGSHFVIAHKLEGGAILWNESGYSVTTQRHKGYAWQALSRTQRDNVLQAPMLDDNRVRNLGNCKTGHNLGQFPDIANECAKSVVELVRSITKFRSVDKMNAALRQAREYEKTGKALCEYVRQGKKKAPAWPLADLPDAVPTDKAQRAAFVVSLARSEILAEYKDKRTGYQRALANMRANLAALDSGETFPFYRVQALSSVFDSEIVGKLNEANKAYALANNRDFPGFKKASAELAPLRAALTARVSAAEHAYVVGRMRFVQMRIARDSHARDYAARNAWANSQEGDAVKANAKLAELAGTAAHAFAPFINRMLRMGQWYEMEKARERVKRELETARSYVPRWPGDARLHYRRALDSIACAREHARFAFVHSAELEACETEAREFIKNADALILQANALRIADWIAGKSNELPAREIGPLARIVGDSVYTTLGACVPLSHACRLARIARRIINAGGKVWPDGTGPRVGHFQVNAIHASGACVIGCHEFSADEALRMLALLEACEACADVSADDTDEARTHATHAAHASH